MSNYALTVTGTTYSGSTSTLQSNTKWTPVANFQEAGVLAVIPPIDTVNASGNGVNVVDFGLYVSDPFATVPAAGALSFATNNELHIVFLHANTSQTSAIDDVFQAYDPATQTLKTVLDNRLAPTIQLNEFDQTGGLLGFPSPILGGEIDMKFSPDTSTVVGSATLFGGGYIEPTTTAWTGTFTGHIIG